MKKGIVLAAFALIVLAGCKKTDNAAKFVGTFSGNSTSSVSRVVITEIDTKTLSVLLEASYAGTYAPFITTQDVTVQSATNATINEPVSVSSYNAIYNFTGTLVLKADTLTLVATAANSADTANKLNYTFTGNR